MGTSSRMRESPTFRLALCPLFMAAVLVLPGCAYPILQCRGGKALVEVSRLKRVPSFDWPIRAYDFLKPPKSELDELDRVVVLSFYDYDIGDRYELLGMYSVSSQGGRFSYPLRVQLEWVRWTAFGFYKPDNRPDLGALVFAPGCLPMYLNTCYTGGGNTGVYIPDEDHPNDSHRPPKWFQARILCIMMPIEALDVEPRRGLAHVNATPHVNDYPDLVKTLGRDNLPRFIRLLKNSSSLSDAERQMIRKQLLTVCDYAMQDPDNKPYLDAFRELKAALAGL